MRHTLTMSDRVCRTGRRTLTGIEIGIGAAGRAAAGRGALAGGVAIHGAAGVVTPAATPAAIATVRLEARGTGEGVVIPRAPLGTVQVLHLGVESAGESSLRL